MKHVCRCYRCGRFVRTNKTYQVYYTGDEYLTDAMPPIQVTDKLVRLCKECYRKVGYVVLGKTYEMASPQIADETEDKLEEMLDRLETPQWKAELAEKVDVLHKGIAKEGE